MEARRRLLMMQKSGLLPAGYTQIEYLESTGTQYINVSEELLAYEFEITLMETAKRSGGAMFTGSSLWSDSDGTAAFLTGSWLTVRRRRSGSASTNEAAITADDALNKKLTMKCYKTLAEISESDTGTVLAVNNNEVSSLYVMPIYLFHGNSNGQYRTRYITGRIYHAKYLYNGNVAYEFIPCIRDSDGEPGMYDIINGNFYSNNGTGTFIIPT